MLFPDPFLLQYCRFSEEIANTSIINDRLKFTHQGYLFFDASLRN